MKNFKLFLTMQIYQYTKSRFLEIENHLISFWDLRISIVGNKSTTTVYGKPTDSRIYLHANSCHKTSSIEGIQNGVVLRLHISGSDNDHRVNTKEYTKYLVNRGHDLKR